MESSLSPTEILAASSKLGESDSNPSSPESRSLDEQIETLDAMIQAAQIHPHHRTFQVRIKTNPARDVDVKTYLFSRPQVLNTTTSHY